MRSASGSEFDASGHYFVQNYVKGHDIFSSKSCVHLGGDFL